MSRWRNLLEILNPTYTTRLWTVSYTGWHSGYSKDFWRKRKALKFANTVLDWNFVTIHNNLTGEHTRLKVDKRTPIINPQTGEWLGFVEDEKC